MRLYLRAKKNGQRVYWASWTQGGVTVRRSTKCGSKAAAQIVVARWERERADPAYHAANEATLGAEASVFLAECKADGLAAGTLSMYVQKARHLLRLLGADTRLALLDAAAVRAYVDTRRSEGAAAGTIYKEWVTLRGVLKSARHRERYHRDPSALKPPRLSSEYKPKKRHLTWAELANLTNFLPRARAQAVALVASTGARRSEAFKIEHGDIDWNAWTIRLRGTKTDDSDRTIPIPEPMRPALAYFVTPSDAAGPILAHWTNARRDLAEACRKLGMEPVTWNDLRRTFASLLIQAGAAPHVVARLLGHTTTAMVDKVYGKTTTESLANLLDTQITPTVNQTLANGAEPVETAKSASDGNDSTVGGPSGTRTRDLRIKRPDVSNPSALAMKVHGELRASRGPQVNQAFPLQEAVANLLEARLAVLCGGRL